MNNMKNTTAIVILGIFIVGVVGITAFTNSSTTENKDSALRATNTVAVVHKSPFCGCCGVYASYMKGEGYEVQINDVDDIAPIKEELGVPYELESCHTTEVGGYVIEGHIPNEVIQKLLREKPDIKGIGMAGMPSGSPGMPGPKTEDFVIYEITHEGTRGDVYMTL